MNNLYNSLMAYRQSRGGMQRPQGQMGQRPRLQGGMMGRPNTPSPTGGYDSSGINPGGGMPRPAPQASPMQAPHMPQPMGGMQQPVPQLGGMQPPTGGAPQPSPMAPQPAPQQAASSYGTGYGTGTNAARPFQLQGGFTSQRLPQSSQPILYNQMPGSLA